MDIDSWTSEGMDWSSIGSLKTMPLLFCFEAVRKACAERLLAILNAELLSSGSSSPVTGESLDSSGIYGGIFGDSFHIEAMPIPSFCNLFQPAMSRLLNSKFLDGFQLGTGVATAAGIEESAYAGQPFSSLPKLTEARALSLINAEGRIEAAPLSSPAGWLHQQHLLLNLLDSMALSPYGGSSSSGGQRYFVELSPWDEEVYGSYYNLALAWAGLYNFNSAEFAANVWNYKHATSGGHAEGFGSTDILSGFTRQQAWREWSKWSYDFGLLRAAGVDFTLKAWQAYATTSIGINEATPTVSNEFSTEIFPHAGYCAMAMDLQPNLAGVLELTVGDDEAVPEIPAAPDAGSKVKGWKLDLAPGPFVAQFDFKFKN